MSSKKQGPEQEETFSESDDSKQFEDEDKPVDFYDEGLDDLDEKWVEKKRDGRRSDAILSCPCCLSTVCLDCQAADNSARLFRAMFIVNCHVARDRPPMVLAPLKGAPSGSQPETMRPVVCSTCMAQVAALDDDEVYHFYNVIASSA